MEVTYGATLESMLAVEGDLILRIRVAYDVTVDSNAGDDMERECECDDVELGVPDCARVDWTDGSRCRGEDMDMDMTVPVPVLIMG